MIRNILSIVTVCLCVVFAPLSADPVEEIITGKDLVEGMDDYLMPTLSELLGEPVDDLGFLGGLGQLQMDLVDYAKNYLGTRYRSGSKGPSAFDCSGFTSFVFRKFGYNLNASSATQSLQGEEVDLKDAEVGDLIFFSGRRISKNVGHVGMITEIDREKGKVKFIHATIGQGVVISTYPDEPYYNNRFISVRHVISDDELLAD